MPNRKIFILTKPTEAFTAKYSAKCLFWTMQLKFIKNLFKCIISIKLQVVGGPSQYGLYLGYFSKNLTANQQANFSNTYFWGQLIWRATGFSSVFWSEVSFMELCSFMSWKWIFWKSGKYLIFTYFFIWMKKLPVEGG